MSPWRLSWRADPEARAIADRHYNRQKPGAAQFVPPGRCVVLVAGTPATALWITSWPFAEYVKHAWAGAWVCSCFRREGHPMPASDLIRAAVAATCAVWSPPPEGMVTFIDRSAVRPVRVRGLDTWGRTWRMAGFEDVGETKAGLLALRLAPERMPDPCPAWAQPDLFKQ